MKCGYCNGTGEHINDANRMTTCEFCGGTGEVEVVGDSVTDVCDKCGGTGFFCEMRMGDSCTLGSPCPHQRPLTNEEWLKQCTTEQLAKVLYNFFMARTFCRLCPEEGVCDIGYECKYDSGEVKDFVEWLKQPHKEKHI